MKKKIIALTLSALMVTGLVGCGSNDSNSGSAGNSGETTLKVGMVTDSGTIDDKSFNQGTWEGIIEAEKSLGIEKNYMQPGGETEANYLTEIQNLYDAGYKFIVTPGYKFETAIYKAQTQYEDAKFVIIDGEPNDGNDSYVVGDNTVAIYFAEEQSGFAAGVAAAVELQTGDLGFIGGMEIPAVQKFNYGFQQGVAYANEHYGSSVTLKAENIVYSGSFVDTALGQQLAAQMYDNGVKAIFAAAGGVGTGVITEAKTRVVNGEEVWVIGVDSDQYADGMYEGSKSVILTSAIKKIDEAAYQMIEAQLNDEFPGGQVLTFNAENDGVGIPAENPNLNDDTVTKVNEVLDAIKNGQIEVKTEL
ncbi:BMP family ABC transporter substrate-binding protein [Clostridium sp. 1001271B_151109_B4]|uniref:BMP family lipoprotein n=1 Tax=Clostridium sp. 1001271B_151109_B4 TaxID=2787148 RepID=UPI0018AA0007|nr:BMP family ABC transporter substrate-binding protein [Clostridium sp. 1001271B_151109_B4]